MKDIKETLLALKTIGDATYEQQQKIHEDKLVTQERFVINMSLALHELDVFQISNFCKRFEFECNIVSVGSGVYSHLQIQFFKKGTKEDKISQ